MFGFSPLCMSASANLCGPSTVTLPSSTLTRRLVPSLLMMRRRSATGLKSTVAQVLAQLVAPALSSFDFMVALPVFMSTV